MIENKTNRSMTILYWVIRALMLIFWVYSIVGLILVKDESIRSYYGLVVINATTIFVITFLPIFIKSKWQVEIPTLMELMFIIYALAGLLFGEMARFYVYVKHWDKIVHFISGGLIAITGFSLINLLNNKPNKLMSLSPFFVALFVVCFAVTIGVIWEIFEYMVDSIAGTNMQRYMHSVTFEPFLGQEALKDTMIDLIFDFAGAVIVAVIGYFDLKRERPLFSRFLIQRRIDSDVS